MVTISNYAQRTNAEREIFNVLTPKSYTRLRIKVNAMGLILAHNHPSGNKQPSESDRNLTRKLKSAGKVLDIPVLDHLILTAEEYFSFADEGFL